MKNNSYPQRANTKEKILTWPFFIVLSYLFIEYGRPQDWASFIGVIRPGLIVTVLAIINLLVIRPKLPPVIFYISAFLIVMLIDIPFSANSYHAFMYTRNMLLMVLGIVIPIMVFVDTQKKVKFLMWFWVIIHISLAIYGMMHNGRGSGSFLGDENDFGLVMNMVLPYGVFLFLTTRGFIVRLFLAISIVLFIGATIATMSRGGFVGLVAVVCVMLVFSPRKWLTGIVTILMIIGALALAPSKYWSEMATIEHADQENDTGHARIYLWGLAWKIYLDNPILGVGPGNYQYTAYRYATEHEKDRGYHVWGRVCHSLYFTLLSELGTTGTIIFLLIMMQGILNRKSLRKKYLNLKSDLAMQNQKYNDLKIFYYMSIAIDISLVAYLVTGAFVSVLYYPHFWILTGFSVAIMNVFNRELQNIDIVIKENSTNNI